MKANTPPPTNIQKAVKCFTYLSNPKACCFQNEITAPGAFFGQQRQKMRWKKVPQN